jgi:hypothetical protein
MVTTMQHGTAKVTKEDAAFLPADLHRWIANHNKSLDQHSFTMYAAYTDGMKSNFCQECAIENAKRGIKTILINTEADNNRMHCGIATKLADRRISNVDEANEIWKQTPWLKNLIVKQLRTQVDLIELLAHIRDLKPGLVIIDYLAQHFVGIDIPSQSSGPATIVQTIGVELVDNGIPVIAAVQGEMDTKLRTTMPETWIHRSTLAFVSQSVELPGDTGSDEDTIYKCITMAIRKNKHGGANNCLIDFFWHPETDTIENTKWLTWADYAHREKMKAYQADEKLREAKEDLKELRKHQKERDKKRGNGEVKGATPLPADPERQDLADLDDEDIDPDWDGDWGEEGEPMEDKQ